MGAGQLRDQMMGNHFDKPAHPQDKIFKNPVKACFYWVLLIPMKDFQKCVLCHIRRPVWGRPIRIENQKGFSEAKETVNFRTRNPVWSDKTGHSFNFAESASLPNRIS
jgi:hypothetical protein